MSAAHFNIQVCWKGIWQQMRAQDSEYNWLLDEDAAGEHDVVTAKDLALFLATVRKLRKSNQRKAFVGRTLETLMTVSNSIWKWLADSLSNACKRLLSSKDVAPARKSGRRTWVQAEGYWNVVELSRQLGVSIRQTLKVRSDDPSLGCCAGQSDIIVNKLLQMYETNSQMAFTNVSHWNIVADGSTHYCKDTLISCAYSWEIDQGVHMVPKIMPPTSHMNNENQLMPIDVQVLAAHRKITRVSAFKQL